MSFSFTITTRDATSRARAGVLSTPHGSFSTPAFIFCATKAAMRVASPAMLTELGTDIILSNTYHLMLQPGAEHMAARGGLQEFTGWRRPMLTDSGGFQIFSLGHGLIADEIKGRGARKNGKTLSAITEEGATFRSYVDGRMHTLTPEGAITIQRKLGADLILVLDECTPYHADRAYTENSLRLSQRWADRCLTEFQHEDTGQQALYGIIQGGVYPDLRADAAKNLAERPFFGQAVGGSLGGTSAQMDEVVGYAMNHAHRERPTHLLGIGGIRDIWVNVAQGIDSFDCVHPTRLARHGGALYPNKRERLNLRNARYANDDRPLQESCACPTCRDHSRAYLHHLTRTGEPLGFLLLVQHNIFFMNRLMREIRAALHEGRFHAAQRAALRQLQSDDDSA